MYTPIVICRHQSLHMMQVNRRSWLNVASWSSHQYHSLWTRHRPTHSWFLPRQLITNCQLNCRFNGDDYSALQRQYLLTCKVSRYCLLAFYGSIGQLQLTLRQRLYSECQRRNIWLAGWRTEVWRGVCLLTDRAVYSIIMTMFTSMTRRRDVSLPLQHSTELSQTFTCAIDIIN